MKKIVIPRLLVTLFTFHASLLALFAQTLNVQVGSVTYQFPAAQCGEMTYSDGTSLTVMGKFFSLNDISSITVDQTEVTDNTVGVIYDGTSAKVTIAGNIARYITPTVNGAHVSIEQSSDVAEEITYTLSGSSSDGEFYTSGAYKATIELNGLTLTNATPVFSGAAVHVQNGKRIKVKVITGTTNTLTDAASGSQKGCLYIKGHAEFVQKGTLNVTGKVKHGIKAGEYITLKNATINVLGAVADGISCNEYFLMESGTVNVAVSANAAKGIKCDIDGDTSTGETTDHEGEDSGNIYISGGDITVKTTGGGVWDSDDKKTKASACLGADGNITISGGTLNLTATGAGGKGINADSNFTATGGNLTVKTSGNAVVASSNGSLSTVTSSQQLDRYQSNYKSSPKGIKADGSVLISDNAVLSVTTTGAGGEGIESKTQIDINGGQVTVNATDDAVNASYNTSTNGTGNLTISGGYVFARSTGNDGLDANGNCYIKGGTVYAIGTSSPEVAIDANSEQQKKLYVTGGTIVAIGGLESGASLSQSCYSASSWNKNTWYALYNSSNLALAFKTPSSGGTTLVVSTSGTTTLKSGVTVSDGKEYFGGMGNIGGTVSGGSSISLSSYTGQNNGGPGGPGGHR